MSKYWFYGVFPKDNIDEKFLTAEQKEIVAEEKLRINCDNYSRLWIGYKVDQGWRFMRHGLETILIEDHRGNIARKKLLSKLKEIYSCSN
jgi:hypothetical protein